MASYWHLFLRLLLILECVSHGLSQGCYFMNTGSVGEVTPAQYCSSVPNQYVACCWGGDSCESNQICHFTHLMSGSSGYYVAGCTDPTYKDSSACSTHCTDAGSPDIVYNSETQLWACCNTQQHGLDCSQPGNETFFAPSPEQLFTTSTASLVSSVTSTASSAPSSYTIASSSPLSGTTASSKESTSSLATSTSMPMAAATSLATPTHAPSGLTTGAQAGIGIGVALVVLAILVGAFLWVRRSRRHKIVPVADSTGPWSAGVAEKSAFDVRVEGYQRPELDARETVQLPALYNNKRQELP